MEEIKETNCLACTFTKETKCKDCTANWNDKSISIEHKEFILDKFSKVQ